MPSNDELYLDWLKTSKSTQTLILQVESGSNTVAERFSFSSREFRGVYPDSQGVSGGWNLSNLDTSSISIKGSGITGFTPDGLVCYQGDDEYQLLTPWDPTVKKLLRVGLSGKRALNGSKLFRASGGTSIAEYDLLTPWDTSTNSIVQTVDLSASLTSISAFAVTENAEYLYCLGVSVSANDAIIQFRFTTPGDSSTLVLVTTKEFDAFSVTDQKDITVDPDSTVIWLLAKNVENELQEYSFATAEDVSTVTKSDSINVDSLAAGALSIATNLNGTLLYLGGLNTGSTTALFNVGNIAPVVQNVLNAGGGFSQDLGSLSFSDFTIENDGRFDEVFQQCEVREHSFRLLFGDQSWDLSETDGPYKFIEVAQGVVNDVVYETSNSIRFKALPRKINLLTTIGSEESPVAYGKCLNVRAILIDSGSDLYRINSVFTDQPLPLRDNGSILTVGAGNDYELNLVGGEFFGEFTTDGSAFGELTGDLNFTTDRPIGVKKITEDILRDSLGRPNIHYHGKEFSGFGAQDAQPLDFRISSDGLKAYMLGGVTNTLYEYSLSSANDIETLVYSGFSFSFDTEDDTAVGFDILGSTLIMAGAENNSIYRYSTGANISLLSYEADSRVIAEDNDIQGVAIDEYDFPNIDTVHRILVLGNEKKSIQTYANLGDFDCAASTHYGSDDGVAVPDTALVGISNDNLSTGDAMLVYVVGAGAQRVFQISIPNNFSGMSTKPGIYEGKSFFLGDQDDTPSCAVISKNGDVMIMLGEEHGDGHQYELTFNYQIPVEILRTNIPGGYKDYKCGTWKGSETQIGSVVKELLMSLSSSFSVNRSGGLSAVRLQDPNTTSPLSDNIITISDADLVYEDYAKRIVHVKSDPAVKKLSLLYSKNHTVQTKGSLGAISEDLKKLYSTEHQKIVAENFLFDCPELSEELPIQSLLTDETEAQTELSRVASLKSVVRDWISFAVNIDVLPVNNTYGVGNVLTLNLDHPLITFGEKAMIVAYRPDYESHKTQLTVYK